MAFHAARSPLSKVTSTTPLISRRGVATTSIVDAKARIQERARRSISGSASKNSSPAPALRPSPSPGFQQVPPISAQEITALRNIPRSQLDESFVGMSGGQIFHEMMLRHDVKHVFGYPGGAILPVFDAIYNSKHFDFVLPRHEQGAGHMAEGYARVSGKPGVVLVTSGPGATNVITPMQDALSDGVPLVVFCGQVATSAIGSDAFQEADVIGISRSCTKWNVMVKDIAELPRRINEAFKIATSGRPGPVLVDLPKDVTAGILRTPLPFKTTTPGSSSLPANPLVTPSDIALIRSAADLINQAERPIIYAGNGVLSSPLGPVLLKKLADEGNIPVTTTLQGLGCFDELDDKSLHMLGMHGSAYANLAMQQADSSPREQWFADIKKWKAAYPFVYEPSTSGSRMKPQEVIEELDKQTQHRKDDVVITTGVGQHQMWAAQHFRWRHPRTMVTSGGLGTMGFGLPSAIGAKVAAPEKTVVDIDGDASFSMTAMELATASQFNIGVKALILNNEFQGMVQQWQDLFYDARYCHTTMTNPDFVLLAKAMGVHAIRCSTADELPSKMKEFLEYDGSKPIVMECMVERNEHVFPMVVAGKALHEQLLHPKLRNLPSSYSSAGL
ncbi:Acetolactate synthase, mitochondrial [Serendipita sp. 398]|nr:Acetolactate synthase, mitochondrial [Serendipita sp. 398]